MRLTIERLRTLILIAAALLLAALIGFLAFGKWKSHFVSHDLPQKLGLDIQQESDGVTFSHALGEHAQFKVTAAKVVQLKQGNALLHGVKIEIYSEDGKRVDRIEGKEFEYDQKAGLAKATGPVEILLTRPGQSSGKQNALNAATAGQVHIKTSLLSFNLSTGIATTTQKVDFSTAQGSGSAVGSTYDSRGGYLELERNVQLNSTRNGESVQVNAASGEFARGDMLCTLHSATASYHGGQASAGEARIEFREDGSAVKLDATNGFTLATASGSQVAAPHGTLDFDQRNQPHHGHMGDGVRMDSVAHGRKTHGTATTADLEFTAQGDLHHAHLEQNVTLHSEEESTSGGAHPEPLHVSRDWRSPQAEIEFRQARRGHTEPAVLTGTGGVEVASHSQRGKELPSNARMHADRVDGQFAAGALSSLVGSGHATMEQNTASGAHQTATGDRIQAHFGATSGKGQLQSAILDQHVTLTQQQAAHAGAPTPAPLRATAGHAEYAGDGQWLHLTVNPRIDQGGMQLTADKIDVSEESGDAFAHGNVKATWGQSAQPNAQQLATLGGQDPAHVVATEAELHQSQNGQQSEATFRGHARLWQQANSVTAPVLVLRRPQQSLEATSSDRNEPVRVTMLNTPQSTGKKPQPGVPTVIRVRGGSLKYSDSTRTALMQSGSLGPVVAETSSASTQSAEVELHLNPAGSHNNAGSAQVEKMIARGHVSVSSEGRHGSGDQLAYTGSTGDYVLTGNNGNTPRLTDPEHGSVSGQALIFHSRDDSVSIEGRGQKTTTQTYAPR